MPHRRGHSSDGRLANLVTVLTVMKEALNGVPIPGIHGAVAALLEVVTGLKHANENSGAFDELREQVQVIGREIVTPLSDPNIRANIPQSLRADIEALAKDLEAVTKNCLERRQRSLLKRVLGHAEDATILANLTREIGLALQRFTTKGVISLRMDSESFRRRTVTDLINGLPHAHAQYDSGVRNRASGCLEGTRTNLLQTVKDWSKTVDKQEPKIFWLCGLAGTGKSTVAQTVAESLNMDGRLGASFFFSRDEADRRNPLLLFSSIAYQLSLFQEVFKKRIADSLELNPDIGRSSMRAQVLKLIVEPLRRIPATDEPSIPVIVLIDALDECDDLPLVIDSLVLLGSELTALSFPLKLFITSRAEPSIASTFTPPSITVARTFLLHDIDQSIVKSDIYLFLRHHLRQLASQYSISLPWPSEDALTALVERAGELFIFAVTALKFISDPYQCDPQAQLDFLLAEGSIEDGKPFGEMNYLYLRILRAEVDDTVINRYQSVMGAIVVLQDPLPAESLGCLLQTRPDAVRGALARLHAVIVVPSKADQNIRLIHPSFPEFLTSSKRCSDERFLIDEGHHHGRIAEFCIVHMMSTLRRDICLIEDPSKLNSEVEDLQMRLKKYIPQHVQYACLYWASHLSKTSSMDNTIHILLDQFCTTKLLQWLEVLSLLDDLASAVHSLKLMEEYIMTCSSLHHLLTLIQDCHKFLLEYYEPIALSSAHIYHTALPFAPDSKLLDTYGRLIDSSVKVLVGRKPSWSLCTRTLEMGDNLGQSIAISPDGLKFVSGHINAAVHVWDVATGVVIAKLTGHNKPVTSVAYSPDSLLIASGSDDNSVRIWDSSTGEVKATWHGQDGSADHRVMCLAFSGDGGYVAFGSSDRLVRIWDVTADPKAELLVELSGHLGRITSVAFSPQGTHLASASKDHTVRIWEIASQLGGTSDTESRDDDVTLLGHYFSVNSVAFSSDGARIITGSDDRSIRIWDPTTGSRIRVIYCQTKIAAVLVVDDGDCEYIVSGCEDGTIRVWNPSTGELRATLQGHFGRAEAIDLSVVNNLLVSSDSDFTIRLWNWAASLKYSRAVIPPKASAIVGVSFSPDGHWIGVASVDGKVQLYGRDGVFVTTLDSQSRSWDSGAGFIFSPDSKRILTRRLDDKLLHLWNTSDGTLIASLHALGRSYSLERVRFSPDSLLLVAWSDFDDIQLWETMHGAPLVILQGHAASVRLVTFAPSSDRLICGCDDGRVLVWDMASHCQIAELLGHCGPVSEITFSADGGVMISRSGLVEFIYWDTISYRRIEGNSNLPVPYLCQTETGGRSNKVQRAGKWRIELEKDWMVLKSSPNVGGVDNTRRLCWLPYTFRGRPLSSNRADVRWDSHGNVAVCGVHTRRLAILDFTTVLAQIQGPS